MIKDKAQIARTRAILDVILGNDIVEVSFTKVNGELRTMRCTRDDDLIPDEQLPIGNSIMKESVDILKVFEVDLQEWRSFRIENLIKFTVQYDE